VEITPPPPALRPEATPPALFRGTAAPLVTGTAAVFATALARWALKQAMRGLVEAPVRRRGPAPGRVLQTGEIVAYPTGRDRTVGPPRRAGKGTVEVFWYRRTDGE
jgi:hypothetical protein